MAIAGRASVSSTSTMSGSPALLNQRLNVTAGKSDQATLRPQYTKKSTQTLFCITRRPSAKRRYTRTTTDDTIRKRNTMRSTGLPST